MRAFLISWLNITFVQIRSICFFNQPSLMRSSDLFQVSNLVSNWTYLYYYAFYVRWHCISGDLLGHPITIDLSRSNSQWISRYVDSTTLPWSLTFGRSSWGNVVSFFELTNISYELARWGEKTKRSKIFSRILCLEIDGYHRTVLGHRLGNCWILSCVLISPPPSHRQFPLLGLNHLFIGECGSCFGLLEEKFQGKHLRCNSLFLWISFICDSLFPPSLPLASHQVTLSSLDFIVY